MKKVFYVLVAVSLIISACTPIEIDDEKPVIDLTYDQTFPLNCDTLYLGEAFTWKVRFTDNAALGSYSLEIHHNFDHHAHSTEMTECVLDPVKTPVHPFQVIDDFEIPAGSQEYVVNREISLPLTDGAEPFEPGDYHFFISLTDREGWSAQAGFNIKILARGSN